MSEDNKTSLGIDENLAGALCYVLGLITGLLFLFLEKESNFVKFHAMQSIITFGGITVIVTAIGWFPIIGWLISILSMPLTLVLWILLMVKAFQGEKYKLPIVGDFAEEQAGRVN